MACVNGHELARRSLARIDGRQVQGAGIAHLHDMHVAVRETDDDERGAEFAFRFGRAFVDIDVEELRRELYGFSY